MTLVLSANIGSGCHAARHAEDARRRAAGGVGNLFFKLAGCVIFLAGWQSSCSSRISTRPAPGAPSPSTSIAVLALTNPSRGRLVTASCPVPPMEPRSNRASTRRAGNAGAALANAVRETLRIGDIVSRWCTAAGAIRTNDIKGRGGHQARRRHRPAYTAVKLYLTQISASTSTTGGAAGPRSCRYHQPRASATSRRVMEDLRDKKIALRLSFSEAGMREIGAARSWSEPAPGMSVF